MLYILFDFFKPNDVENVSAKFHVKNEEAAAKATTTMTGFKIRNAEEMHNTINSKEDNMNIPYCVKSYLRDIKIKELFSVIVNYIKYN